MRVPPFRVTNWNRALGRGEVSSSAHGALAFDAGSATVDDFVVGEPVHVELEPNGGSFRVVRIWPDDPRVASPFTREGVPPLSDAKQAAASASLASIPVLNDYRVKSLTTSLTIEADNMAFYNGPDYELEFIGVVYMELPTWWSGKAFRLANSTERAYLGSRCELTEDLIGVKIVDDELRAFFVVAYEVRVRTTT